MKHEYLGHGDWVGLGGGGYIVPLGVRQWPKERTD